MASINAEQVFVDLGPAISALRDLATFADFADDAPELSPAEAKVKIALLEDAFRSCADAINTDLHQLSRDLNSAEKAATPFNPATMMKMAASHRTGGAPDPLPALFEETAETGPLNTEKWAALKRFAEARRRYFVYWFGTLESFRKNAIRRASQL